MVHVARRGLAELRAPLRVEPAAPPPERRPIVVAMGWTRSERHPDIWISRVLGWRDAWWRKALCTFHGGASGPEHRLGRGHRHVGYRRWDDAIQAIERDSMGDPWQVVAQHRQTWQPSETGFTARVARGGALASGNRAQRMPHARRVMSRRDTGMDMTLDARWDASELIPWNSGFACIGYHANNSHQTHTF